MKFDGAVQFGTLHYIVCCDRFVTTGDTAFSDKQAYLARCRGDFHRAERHYESAVQLRAQVLSRSDPELASSINGLAILCRKMGHYEKAEPLYRCALELRRKVRVASCN